MTLVLQDPSRDDGPILLDELLRAFDDLRFKSWRGLYAFGSAAGAIATLEDPAFEAFIARGGTVDLLIGLDAVTNPAALVRLREHSNEQIRIDVFTSARSGSIFHPKVSVFTGDDDGRLVVGSGNFTEGGLRRNYEAFAIFDDSVLELRHQWLAELHQFRAKNLDRIGPIDEDAIERARRNERIAKAARRAAREEVDTRVVVVPDTDDDVLIAQDIATVGADRRTLIAQVPMARWGQVQFDKGTAESFFGLKPGATFAVTLQGVDEGGDLQSPEARRLVFSSANANPKIEFSSRRDRSYPDVAVGRPILVVREDAPRTFAYSLFMPGDADFADLQSWVEQFSPTHGGMRRPQVPWAEFVEAVPGAAARISDAIS